MKTKERKTELFIKLWQIVQVKCNVLKGLHCSVVSEISTYSAGIPYEHWFKSQRQHFWPTYMKEGLGKIAEDGSSAWAYVTMLDIQKNRPASGFAVHRSSLFSHLGSEPRDEKHFFVLSVSLFLSLCLWNKYDFMMIIMLI